MNNIECIMVDTLRECIRREKFCHKAFKKYLGKDNEVAYYWVKQANKAYKIKKYILNRYKR